MQQAFDEFLADRNARQLLETRTQSVDTLVSEAAASCLNAKVAVPFAITAVGGYGRRGLFPFSDVDVLVLVKDESGVDELKGPLSEFLRTLWDNGLRASHSVRTVAECGRLNEQNAELHVSLLDLRLVCGDGDLFVQLQEKLPEMIRRDGTALIRRLVELTRHRHAKFNNTIYHLEPNIKESPGGIRDLHVLRWLAQLLPQQESIRDSVAELASAEDFLFTVRCFLHIKAGRDNNLLTFELQDETAHHLPAEPIKPEAWMRLYHQQARRIFQCVVRALEYAELQDPSMLRQFREWRSRFSTSEFTVSHERVLLRNPAETLLFPDAVLRLFAFTARHGFRLSWDTQRRSRVEIGNIAQLFRDKPPAWLSWRDLFVQPHAAIALQEMQETGVLAAAMPEWASVDGLVVRDFYHRYTVDEHTLVAIETIDNLIAAKPETPARFHDLPMGEDDQVILRLALLLHDIGKGTEPGNHVHGSTETAAQVMARLDTPKPIQKAVVFLIEHHLDLSLIMNSRDLDDPATARFLTTRVGTQEDLRRLVLLTYADINAVNPTAMTPWRLEQLWRVYSAGIEQLTHELATDRIHDDLLSPGHDGILEEFGGFLDGLPKRYLRTHSPDQIRRHAALEQKAKREGVAVEISREAGAYLLTVVAQDAPGLFASLCGALASFGMNIVKAEAASNAAGSALDFIRFADPMRTLELNPEEVNRIEWTIECVVRGSINVTDLLKRRRRVPRPASVATVAPTVRFNNEASDGSTLIEFVGEDRPGLLYDLASALSAHQCDIEIVMIDTEAHKALDVFYVTRERHKLTQHLQDRLGSELVAAAGA